MLKPGVLFSALVVQSGEKKTPCTTALVQLAFVLLTLPSTLPRGSRIARSSQTRRYFTFTKMSLSLSLTKERISAVSSAPANRKSISVFLAGVSILPPATGSGGGVGGRCGISSEKRGAPYIPLGLPTLPTLFFPLSAPRSSIGGRAKAAKATPGELQKERRATGGNHASWRV